MFPKRVYEYRESIPMPYDGPVLLIDDATGKKITFFLNKKDLELLMVDEDMHSEDIGDVHPIRILHRGKEIVDTFVITNEYTTPEVKLLVNLVSPS